jgi:serine/threonine-protein kinase
MRAFDSDNDRASSSVAATSSITSELEAGQILDDRFEVLGAINRGGMAWIYKALDLQTGKLVALKVPLMQLEGDAGFLSRFQREENIGLTLAHPCIVNLVPAEDKSRPYLVMEFLEGRTLAARLRENAPLPEGEAARIAGRICQGLDYLHRKGVAHRDLKPENIMLCKDGTVRIMDFGIAKSDKARRLTLGGFPPAMGTPDYIAPEQVEGKRGDFRSDIYALGAMLYEMTTGLPPYDGDNPYVIMNARLAGDPDAPRRRNPRLSPEIEEIILHALERTPANRFPSAAAMRSELNDYRAVSLTERFKRLRPPQLWKAKAPLPLKIAALVAAQIAIFLLLLCYFSHRSRGHSPAPATQPGVVEAGQPMQ